MDFALFILVTAILFIRPMDYVPGLAGFNLYLIAIVPCILLSWHKLIPQLTWTELRERPVLVFGSGVLLVSTILNLVHGKLQTGFEFVVEFGKVLLFYLLMLAHLDSVSRLKRFLGWLVGLIMVAIVMAVLNYHGYVKISVFRTFSEKIAINPETGEGTSIRRLAASGIFADPNDICEIINCAMIFTLYRLLDWGGGCTRVIWLVPMTLFGYALALTNSRGGFLGAVVGLIVLFWTRLRGVKSLVLAGIILAVILFVFAGRQTAITVSESSSQSRIQVWDAAFGLLIRSRLIGGGLGSVNGDTGHVAHNAFIQAYAEMGLLGGTLFFGQYFYCLKNLAELGSKQIELPDPEMRRLQPFLLASLAGFATAEMSLSNGWGLVTYTMLGVASVGIRLADPSPPLSDLRLSASLLRRTILYSALFLLGLYFFTRLTVQY